MTHQTTVKGFDFTSAPTRKKPITCPRGMLMADLLPIERIDRISDFELFDAVLREPERSMVSAGFCCCLSQDVSVGGIHDEDSRPERLKGGGIMLDAAQLGSIAQQMMSSNTVNGDYSSSLSRAIPLNSCANLFSRSSASFSFASRARSLKALAFLCTSTNGFVYC